MSQQRDLPTLRSAQTRHDDERERVVIVGIQLDGVSGDDADSSLDELGSLVDSAGGEVVGRLTQKRPKPDPATFIGRGKVTEVIEEVGQSNADTVVFDEELAPSQLRNLEEKISSGGRPTKVIDRTILILDIFAQRATSTEGKKQVELAQLTYGLPRLRGWGEALTRIGGASGGGGRGGGGGRAPIGTRGPGETQLEVDRRRIQRRIQKLQEGARGARRPPGPRAQAPRGARADRLARRLHERREVDAAEPPDRCRRRGRGPSVHDSRSHRAPSSSREQGTRRRE